MKSLKTLYVAGLALLGLTLAQSTHASVLPASATPMTESEMDQVHGGTVYVWITHHFDWAVGGTFYLTVQTPRGPIQTPVWIQLNAYYKTSTTTDGSWYNGDGSFGVSLSQAYAYAGGPINGVRSSSLRTDVGYFHVVNGWPVAGL